MTGRRISRKEAMRRAVEVLCRAEAARKSTEPTLPCETHGLDVCPTCGQHVPDGVKLPGEDGNRG